MNNSHRAKNGVKWSAIERFAVQGVQFIISLFLARLLSPSDFGLIALVLIVLNILNTINEVGFGAALMQKLDRDELDYSSVFVLNIFLGIFLYIILYISAPFIELFFDKIGLTSLIRIVGLNLIITSLIVVQRAKLLINVDFVTQAKASLISTLTSGIIGIICAYNGLGVMALVYQSIINNGLNTILIWSFVKWKPKFKFSYVRFTRLFKFAYKLILARLINSVFQELYSIIIGRIYAPEQLGFFNRAKSFEQLSSNNIAGIIQRVSIPFLCETQKNHLEMGHVLTKFITSTALIVYPLLCGIFVLSEPLISVLLTDKWMSTAWMLKILCPVGLFSIISSFNRNVFNATGRTGWALKTEVIKKIIFIFVIAISIYWGLTVVIISQLIIAIIEFIIDTHYTKKQIGLSVFTQIKALKGVFLASIIMGAVIWVSTYSINNDVLKLVLGFVIGSTTYIVICYINNIGDFKKLCTLYFK